MQKKSETLPIDIDKLAELYCFLNNRIHSIPRKKWYNSLFLGSETDDVEDFFIDLKSRLVDMIDAGLGKKSELTRTILPIVLKKDDVKKYLQS